MPNLPDPDVIARAEPFLAECAKCDYRADVPCTCPTNDHRLVIFDLVREVQRLRRREAETYERTPDGEVTGAAIPDGVDGTPLHGRDGL